MPQNNHLSTLISSLNTQEKQYISKRSFSFLRDKNPKYLEILDLIYQYPDESDAEIRLRMKTQVTPNNFAVAKKYLMTFICESLTDYYKHDDSEIALLKEVEILTMLIRKGQFDLCFKLWKNTIRKATDQEIYPVMLHLKEIYQQLILYYQIDLKVNELEDAITEYRDLEKKHGQFQQMLSLYYEVSTIRKKAHFRIDIHKQERLHQIIGTLSLINTANENSFLFHHYYRLTSGTVYYLIGEFNKAYPILKDNIECWQANPNKIKKDNTKYLEAMYGFLAVAMLADTYEKAFEVLGNVVNSNIHGSYNNSYFEYIQFTALNRIYNRSLEYDKVTILLPLMEVFLGNNSKLILLEHKRVLLVSMGIAYFALGKIADAYSKIFIVKSFFYDKSRIEQVSFTYLFILLIAYELNDDTIFRNEYNNTYHYFYSKQKPQPFEKEIFSSLHRAFGQPEEIIKQIFSSLLKRLEEEKSDIILQRVFQIFNFPDWFNSKLNGMSYNDYRIKTYTGITLPVTGEITPFSRPI